MDGCCAIFFTGMLSIKSYYLGSDQLRGYDRHLAIVTACRAWAVHDHGFLALQWATTFGDLGMARAMVCHCVLNQKQAQADTRAAHRAIHLELRVVLAKTHARDAQHASATEALSATGRWTTFVVTSGDGTRLTFGWWARLVRLRYSFRLGPSTTSFLFSARHREERLDLSRNDYRTLFI